MWTFNSEVLTHVPTNVKIMVGHHKGELDEPTDYVVTIKFPGSTKLLTVFSDKEATPCYEKLGQFAHHVEATII